MINKRSFNHIKNNIRIDEFDLCKNYRMSKGSVLFR
jgi:hypothetical protein